MISTSITVDTDAPTFPIPLPPGGSFGALPQPDGPTLAVLQIGDLELAMGATVQVVGSRPFVILASGSVTLEGVIDAGARANVAGAGGAGPGLGLGAGLPGVSNGAADGGGGGGGFASTGAQGGPGIESDLTAAPGVGGSTYGDPSQPVLLGGSGGGAGKEPATCPAVSGGAGGGAIQISALGAIFIGNAGGINVGGGGGAGGASCGANAGAGSGGGSGGAIYLQAASLENTGVLAANGGGGGGGGDDEVAGASGGDGTLGLDPGVPGREVLAFGAAGGAGGALGSPPAPGGVAHVNGGGGGGAHGRILLDAVEVVPGLASPAPELAPR